MTTTKVFMAEGGMVAETPAKGLLVNMGNGLFSGYQARGHETFVRQTILGELQSRFKRRRFMCPINPLYRKCMNLLRFFYYMNGKRAAGDGPWAETENGVVPTNPRSKALNYTMVRQEKFGANLMKNDPD